MPISFTALPAKAKPDCARCPFGDPHTGQPRHAPVMGTCLSLKGTVGVLVGESPGDEEVAQGEVFKGRTGKWLDAQLRGVGLDRDDLSIVNAIGCQPPKGAKTDSNMGKAASACFPMFEHQFERYKGLKPVLAMGKWAAYSANNQSPITVETGRGFVRGQLIVTWHPTYAAFYNPWKAGEFINDLERFKRLLDGHLESPPTTLIRPTVADIEALLVQAKGVIAVDIETRAPHGQPAHLGKDPTRADMRTIAFGTADRGLAYWWGSNPHVQHKIVRVLEDDSIVKVFHNGPFFDHRVIRRYGIKLVNTMDTRDMRRAVSATSRLSLRFLASVYSDFAPWKEDEK